MKKEEIDKCLKLMDKCNQYNRGTPLNWYRLNDNTVGFQKDNGKIVEWVESIMEDEEIEIETGYESGETYILVELTNDQAIIFMEKVNEELDDRYKKYFEEKGVDWIS